MNCRYCNESVYVTRICPYCKEYYCVKHYEPSNHLCPSFVTLNPSKSDANENVPPSVRSVQKALFFTAFTMVLLDSVLRLVGWMKFSPFFEPNLYVAILSQFFNPYFAAVTIFLAACVMLFVIRHFSNFGSCENDYVRVFRIMFPIGVYVVMIVIFAFSVLGWLVMLP